MNLYGHSIAARGKRRAEESKGRTGEGKTPEEVKGQGRKEERKRKDGGREEDRKEKRRGEEVTITGRVRKERAGGWSGYKYLNYLRFPCWAACCSLNSDSDANLKGFWSKGTQMLLNATQHIDIAPVEEKLRNQMLLTQTQRKATFTV